MRWLWHGAEWRRFGRDRRGNSFVEFAFIAPLLILATVGVFDVGRMVWTISALNHAARETARYAAIHGSASSSPTNDTELTQKVADNYIGIGKGGTSGSGLATVVDWSPGMSPGSTVTITVANDFYFWTFGFFTGKTFTITGRGAMTVM